MVITNGIQRAVEYYFAIKNLLAERKSQYKAIVAFSGDTESIRGAFSRYYKTIMNDILKYANTSKAENKVIILDCCHAGAMGNILSHNTGESIVGNGVTILTSSRDDESSMEIYGRVLLANLPIEALNGGAANIQGEITPGSVYAFTDAVLLWMRQPDGLTVRIRKAATTAPIKTTAAGIRTVTVIVIIETEAEFQHTILSIILEAGL